MTGRNLILIDGTGLLYRAYFAITHLSTRDGLPTNGVFGFIRMFRQVARVWNPTHLVTVFDGGVPEERLSLLPEYKAQRPPMPDMLRKQVPLVEEFLDRSETCRIRVEGQEADDVMASVAAQARAGAAEEIIVSSDKDMLQLVDDRLKVVRPTRIEQKVGAQEVAADIGVAPAQVPEWLALTGDSVDNISGVPGVGPKTAAKLLARYGSLGNLWERIQSVEPEKLRNALASNRDVVLRNLTLVRLRTDLECGFAWDRSEFKTADSARLGPFFERLEFHSLASQAREPSLPGMG